MIQMILGRLPVVFKTLTKSKLDALEELRADHMKVELLYGQYKLMRDWKIKNKIIAKITDELSTHARIEEEVFYPACEKVSELREIVAESYEEHKQIKMFVKDLSGTSLSNEEKDAKIKVLMEDVIHHVGEEENTLFPKVRKAMSQNKLEKMGGQLRTAKESKTSSKSRQSASKAA